MTKTMAHRIVALSLGGCLMLGGSVAMAQSATSPSPMQSGSQPPSAAGTSQPGGMAMQQGAMEECPMMKHSAQMAANMEKMQQQMAQMTAMMQKMQDRMGATGKP